LALTKKKVELRDIAVDAHFTYSIALEEEDGSGNLDAVATQLFHIMGPAMF
jgi:hypothetical protein